MGSLQLLAVINKAVMNIVEHVSLLYVGTSFGDMSRIGIVGSSGNSIFSFSEQLQNLVPEWLY